MVYRVIFTFVTGFALFFGSTCPGQAETPIEGTLPESGAVVEQTNSPFPTGADNQSPNTSDSTAIARWWQRFTPPPGANGQPANAPATKVAPAPQTATNAAGSTWSFGKLFKGNDKKREQTDPFAVKAASYDEPAPNSTVVVAESIDPTNCAVTPLAEAAQLPLAAQSGDSLAAIPGNGCPYPDTGIQNLNQPLPGTNEAVISDRPTSPAQPPPVASVRGAFDGLLGQDDVRTQKEAASLPLLSPYKELPVGYPQTATSARAVKQGPSEPPNGQKAAIETEQSASTSAVTQNAGYTDQTTIDSHKETVVGAAFTLPPSDAKSQVVNAQGSGNESGAMPASQQAASPQPLQLNGVEAHQLTGSPLNRPKFIYRPATSVVDNAGRKLIRPEVHVAADSVANPLPTSVQLAQFAAATEGNLPTPANIAPETAYPIDEQQWMPPMAGFESGACDSCQDHHGHGWHGRRDCCRSGGIGAEHVMQAPFFIQTTQPFNNCRVRLDLAQNLEFPDRSEYFWAKTPGGKGPGPDLPGETSVDYRDLSFYIEKGFKRFSIGTTLPIRDVDPEIRDNSTGFADMDVRTKTVLMDGVNWQLTQLFNTYLPTGTAHHGTGNGHVSLEPGVAYRWKWSDWTYLHGDLKYLFPIGADPDFAGQIFNYGIGISHVWIETDTWALIPTFELEAWTFVDGRQTLPNTSGAGCSCWFRGDQHSRHIECLSRFALGLRQRLRLRHQGVRHQRGSRGHVRPLVRTNSPPRVPLEPLGGLPSSDTL